MNPETWSRVKTLLNDCLALNPAERKAHLDAACAGDATLRAEVESLLESHSRAGEEFLESSIFDKPAENLVGQQMGLYQIAELIGEGGMGSVYRAVRASDFQKQVAIKLVKAGMDTDSILRRFHQERQILAALDHPNIARLLDGGATADGRPYLVMEYIQGTPITEYCREHDLSQSACLELFRSVCSAVQYAHQHLIVHRDLKPGNILVTSDGVPKLLDFGIAKLLEPDAESTRTLFRMMSPECASPEQVQGANITTASDIYSLGVLLYNLLTGTVPYEFGTLTSAEIARVVCEIQPRNPSSIRPMPSDLDTIVLKAMHKEPARRYVSAEQLSEDIRRFLAGLPVLARKDTVAYRLSKFVHRHRAATAATALAALSLVAGMAATLWQAHRARVQQQIAAAVNDFLRNDVLAQAGSLNQASGDARPDPDLKVRTALDRAAARIEGKFNSQPQVEAAIRQTIGDAYEELGLYPAAQQQVERALDLRRRSLGEKNPTTLASMNTLGVLYDEEGRHADAAALQSQVLDLRRRTLGPQAPETLATMSALGLTYKHLGQYTQAEPLLSRALAARRRVLGDEHPDTLISMNDLAALYDDEGKYTQAEPLYISANAIRRRVLGDEHPFTVTGMNNLAVLYSHEGKYADAEAITAKVLEIRQRILGPEHPLTLTTMSNLAIQRIRQGKFDQAEPVLSSVLETRRRNLGPENPDTLLSMNNLAGLYYRQSKYAQAEPLYFQALQTQRRVLGSENPRTLATMSSLAVLYQAESKFAGAEQLFSEALATRTRVLGPRHPDTLTTMVGLASLDIEEAKYSAAEPLLLSAYQNIAALQPPSRPLLEQTNRALVKLYELWKKPDKAAEWRQKLQPKSAGQ